MWSMSNTVDLVKQHFQDASSHLFDIVIVYIHPSLNAIFQTWGDPTQDPMISCRWTLPAFSWLVVFRKFARNLAVRRVCLTLG